MTRRLAPLFSLLLALASCGSPTAVVGSYQLGEPFWLRVDRSAVSSDASTAVRFVRLVNDSRCLPPMVCVWEGDAVIEVGVRVGAGAETVLQLHTTLEPRVVTIEGIQRRVELLALRPLDRLASTDQTPWAQLRVSGPP